MTINTSNYLQEMEDPTFIHHCQMQSLGDSFDVFDFDYSFSSENSPYTSSCSPKSSPHLSPSTGEHFQVGEEKPAKQLKTASRKLCPVAPKTHQTSSSSSSCLISFGNPNPIPADTPTLYGNLNYNGKPKDEVLASQDTMNLESIISRDYYQNQDYSTAYGQGTKRLSSTRNAIQNQEHVISERKRREKLNQRFIALSAIVPGLKKVRTITIIC